MTHGDRSRLARALLGRYDIVHELGSGGMATVYLATDLRHDRGVAIKVLRPDVVPALGVGAFLDEIRIAAQLTHPHIMPVLDSGDADGFLYYVMPYAEGASLADRIAHRGPLPIADVVAILRDVLDGLAHAHSRGVVHRDIKPGNVLFHGGRARILDLGIAKALRASFAPRRERTVEGMAVGTPSYMAPEQASADPGVDHRADLYAVGVLAYEMLAGRPPFTGDPAPTLLRRHVAEAPVPIAERRRDTPPALATLVMRCLEKRPDDRWQCAAEMLPLLDAVRTSLQPPPPRSVGPAPGVDDEVGSRRWLAVLGALATAVLACVAGWGWLSGAEQGVERRAVVGVFENRTGDAAFDPLGTMLQSWLTEGLAESGVIEAVPTVVARQASAWVEEAVREGRARDPIAALSDESGADIVVWGFVHRTAGTLQVHIAILEVRPGEPPRQVAAIDPVRGSADDPTELFAEAGQRLLGALAAELDVRLRAQIGGSRRAPRFDAYQAFDSALGRYAAREWPSASALFLEAFERDETYPVPLLYAALSLRNHGQWSRSDSVVRLLEARRGALSRSQGYWVDYSRAVLEGDVERALQLLRIAVEIAPASKAAYNLALLAVRTGRPKEAREALATLDPDRGAMRGESRWWMRQIEASHHLEEHELELVQVDELERRYPEERTVLLYRIRAYAALGWAESIKAALAAEAASLPPDLVAVRYRNAAVELYAHGHREKARDLAELGVAWIEARRLAEATPGSFMRAGDLDAAQQLRYQKGRLLEVLGERRAALAIYEALLAELPEAWFLRAHAGVLHASLGHISDAMRTDRWLQTLDVPFDVADVTAWRAGLHAALGDRERATALVELALAQGISWNELHGVFHLHQALYDHRGWLRLMAPRG